VYGHAADMGSPLMKLTDKIVDALPVPAKGNKRYPDSEVRGLNAQVTAAGERGFVLRYRIRGRERLYTIGSRPTWTTVASRNRAKDLRRLIDQGIDPHEQEAKARNEAVTIAEFWCRVYEPLHVRTKRPKWAKDIQSMMRNDILPRLGARAVKDVDHADVAALHRQISKRAPARANRVKAVVSHLMTYAERPHVTEDGTKIPALRPPGSNPARGVPTNYEEARQRFLSPSEIARLAEVLERHPERTSVALTRFLLLTGCRFSEATNATWNQINFESGTWTKPSSHTKQKRTHVVYLSKPALVLLGELRERNGPSQYIFAGSTGRPLTTIKRFWHSVTRQAGIEGGRVHDLRHTYAAILASGGASLVLIGQLLASQASTSKRYSHLIDDIQREAVERAGRVITGSPSAAVVPMRRRS
jgi:integrase